MATKKRTKTTDITVERTETSIIRKTKRLVMGWCVQCGEEVRMITPEDAASRHHVSTRTIFALIEAGRIHFTETAEGLVLVCTSSLSEKEIKR